MKMFVPMRLGALAVSLLGCLLLVYGLVRTMQYYTRPAPVDAARVAERRKALLDQQAAERAQLNTYGWVDQARGVVRLPIAHAMDLTRIEYRDAAAARTNLWKLLDKATAPLAKPPAPANPFE